LAPAARPGADEETAEPADERPADPESPLALWPPWLAPPSSGLLWMAPGAAFSPMPPGLGLTGIGDAADAW